MSQPLDEVRIKNLIEIIGRLNADIPINPELLALVDQALTHVSSGRARNLERLEFLGDAVLRLARASSGRPRRLSSAAGFPADDSAAFWRQ